MGETAAGGRPGLRLAGEGERLDGGNLARCDSRHDKPRAWDI
jgi:hypothetical protein